MPQENYRWLPRPDILSLEEFALLGRVFVSAGGKKIKLTGGEPLLRNNLAFLVQELAAIDGLEDLSMTTNGYLLASQAAELRHAGLHRLNISLDTLQRQRFIDISKVDGLDQCIDGILVAQGLGFENIKLDMVVMKGVNDDEIIPMLEFALKHNLQLRFIEYMDVGGALNWSPEYLITAPEILELITEHYSSPSTVVGQNPSDPARLYELPNGSKFGIIASMSEAFCASCDRSRVTADGNWYPCLYASAGHNLRDDLRRGDEQQLQDKWRQLWSQRDSQEAVLRAKMPRRMPAMNLDELIADPHLEMHTRGG